MIKSNGYMMDFIKRIIPFSGSNID